jgi:hypothetical protein
MDFLETVRRIFRRAAMGWNHLFGLHGMNLAQPASGVGKAATTDDHPLLLATCRRDSDGGVQFSEPSLFETAYAHLESCSWRRRASGRSLILKNQREFDPTNRSIPAVVSYISDHAHFQMPYCVGLTPFVTWP